jgi:hypothetical protein
MAYGGTKVVWDGDLPVSVVGYGGPEPKPMPSSMVRRILKDKLWMLYHTLAGDSDYGCLTVLIQGLLSTGEKAFSS